MQTLTGFKGFGFRHPEEPLKDIPEPRGPAVHKAASACRSSRDSLFNL